ncbi:methyltransferase domain-containing protein [Luteimonas sp. SX5]|uniref:Methyltransferase domain-containing protein n=1 Tax=Luteimonas galliterrae TaxID=2940486 RepID=A0ABT0MID9_9GAMM|nr:methyltransferase domain-containing protein [Luteimonas galliterrae]MCL1634638.1 methyltransferase domain-containing protein [Luteimonas galliterrae]
MQHERAQAERVNASPTAALPVDEIMRRVRAEIVQRGGIAFPDEAGTAGEAGDPLWWRPAADRLPEKREYALADLLAFSDADFVVTAYRVVLFRSPDEEGFRHFLSQLRLGNLSKVEVLGALRWSAEGRARGVHIDGLLAPYVMRQWRRKRVIGPLIGWLHAFARLGSLPDRLAGAESAQARELQQLGRQLNHMGAQLDKRLAAIEPSFAEMQELQQLGRQLNHMGAQLDKRLAAIEPNFTEMQAWLSAMREHERRSADAAKALHPLYAAFEDRFRGPQSLVRARIEPYLEWLREADAGTPDAPVLDLGCGRGEWLALLRDHGMVGRGIDLNRVFIDMCRVQGLDVAEADAIDSLKAMPAGSVGAVTSMHLVEHLPFERMIEMLDHIHRVLRPGGIVLLETPNPENLSVGSCNFYMDPTHRNPLPPEMLRWIVEARGFAAARIERLTHERDLGAPPLLSESIPGATSVNVLLASLSAAPDYAILARRP